jgi:hypothetical protein
MQPFESYKKHVALCLQIQPLQVAEPVSVFTSANPRGSTHTHPSERYRCARRPCPTGKNCDDRKTLALDPRPLFVSRQAGGKGKRLFRSTHGGRHRSRTLRDLAGARREARKTGNTKRDLAGARRFSQTTFRTKNSGDSSALTHFIFPASYGIFRPTGVRTPASYGISCQKPDKDEKFLWNFMPKPDKDEKFLWNSMPKNRKDEKFLWNSMPKNRKDEKFLWNSTPKTPWDEKFLWKPARRFIKFRLSCA